MACITGDGSYLKPLIVVKRKTVEARICRLPIADKLYISDNESGFITGDIFDTWVKSILIPYVQEKRKQFNYSGPAVLLLDGCSCHYTSTLYRLCNENNIKIFFLPPHSSNQTQPLDLVVFHLHKDKIRKNLKLEADDIFLMEKLNELLSSFQSIATLNNIKSSFEASGAVYEVGNSIYPVMHFSRSFATHLLSNPKTKQEKKEISKQRKGLDLQEHETRLKISGFSNFASKAPVDQEKIMKCLSKVPQIIDPARDLQKNGSIHSRLLLSLVRQEKVTNDRFYPEQPKGRPKKQEKVVDENYMILSFEQKLLLELQSLGLNDGFK